MPFILEHFVLSVSSRTAPLEKPHYTQLDIYDIIRSFNISRGSFNLLKRCLNIDFKSRIKLEDIIDDKWIEDYYLDKL